MTYAAGCTDCGWTFEHDEQATVADQLERHSQKERHHVEFTRWTIDAPG